MLKINHILLSAILASACAVPVRTVTEDKYMVPQSKLDETQLPIEGEMPSFDQLPKGGHFAAWEQPELMVSEMRTALKSLRLDFGRRRAAGARRRCNIHR